MKQLSEEFVRNNVLVWLSKQGYGFLSKVKTLAEHWGDIKVRRTGSGNYFVVECKGESCGKDPWKARDPSFVSALGEIFQRVKYESHYRYGLTVPATYRSLVHGRIPWVAAKKIRLEVLLVDEKGKVDRITWEDLKGFQVTDNSAES